MTGRPAVRVTDRHACPFSDGLVPHMGGAVLSAPAPEVLAAGLPLAAAGSLVGCEGALGIVLSGSATVLVAGWPVARMGDATAHGGVLVDGASSILVGG